MAVNNRSEATTEVNADIVATVTNTIHRNLLNNKILNSVLFRKDVAGSATPDGTGKITVNFLNDDIVIVNTTLNATIYFQNLEIGDSAKYIFLTKNASNTVSFNSAIDVSAKKRYINSNMTTVVYRVTNKNNNIYVEAINVNNELQFEYGDLVADSDITWKAEASDITAKYCKYGNMINISCKFAWDLGGSGSDLPTFVATLNTPYRPLFSIYTVMQVVNGQNTHPLELETDGKIFVKSDFGQNQYFQFNATYMIADE